MFCLFKNDNNHSINSVKEIFTYHIPSPPDRPTGYREKELDSLFALFYEYSIDFEVTNTAPSSQGLWVFISLNSTKVNFENLRSDGRYQDFSLTLNAQDESLEIISEGTIDFTDVDNFKA